MFERRALVRLLLVFALGAGIGAAAGLLVRGQVDEADVFVTGFIASFIAFYASKRH